MRSEGLAYDTMADALNAAKIPARKGRWHATSVSRVFARSKRHSMQHLPMAFSKRNPFSILRCSRIVNKLSYWTNYASH